MTRYIKVLIIVVVIVAIAIIAHGITDKTTPAASQAGLKIGSILPLTGDFASFGSEINRGAEIAVDEARQSGINIEYVSEDDRSEPTKSVDAANKLVHADNVDVAFTATVQEVKPTAPIFNNGQTPLIAVWDSNDFIKTAGSSIFTTGFGTEAAGQTMARHAHNTLGLQKVAVIPMKDDWSSLIADAYIKEFTKLGGTVTMSEQTSANQKDFRTLIAKAQNSGAEGIYAPLLPQAGGPFLKQTRELNFHGPIMMGDSFSQNDVNVANGAAENVYFTNLYASQTDQLSAKYKAKFSATPSDPIFVSFGYDAIKTIIAAHHKAIDDKTSIKQALLNTKLQGTGTLINFNGKQYSERLEKLYQVKNGRFIEIK